MATYQSSWDAAAAGNTQPGPLITPFFASPIDSDSVVFPPTSFSTPGLNSVPSDLLLHFDGGEDSVVFSDSSSYSHAITPSGGAIQKTAAAVFGASGGRFTSPAELTSPDAASWDIFAGDFFTEFRMKLVSTTGSYGFVTHVQDANNRYFIYASSTDSFGGTPGAGRWGVVVVVGGAVQIWLGAPAGTLVSGQQYTLGVERFAGTLYLFVDGIVVGSAGYSGTPTFTGPLTIGSNGLSGSYLEGDMDELRIQHKEGAQGSNYIVNTAAYTK